jgi:glyoxylase-like metal-dependent hydrolase (beta-lactamase superfamily II)
MTTGSAFRVGNTEGTIVQYGESAGPPSYLFPEAPPEERDRASAKHLIDGTNLSFVYSSLLLRRGDDIVVVDSGPGPSTGALDEALLGSGTAADAVPHVILSHAHPDHVGGLVTAEQGENRPRFPKATHHLLHAEWQHWMHGASDPMAGQTRQYLTPVAGADLFETYDDETEILPGIVLVPTPGHTPGHLSVIVHDQGETLVYLGDVVTHAVMVEHPEWHSVFDTVPGLAAATRRRMIESVTDTDAVVVASHLPVPGRIRADAQSGQTFSPLELNPHTHSRDNGGTAPCNGEPESTNVAKKRPSAALPMASPTVAPHSATDSWPSSSARSPSIWRNRQTQRRPA